MFSEDILEKIGMISTDNGGDSSETWNCGDPFVKV